MIARAYHLETDLEKIVAHKKRLHFTCATTGEKAKVEYTFGYKRNNDGKARIFLHHSSVPYGRAL